MTLRSRQHWEKFLAFFQTESLWTSVRALAIGVLSGFASVLFRYILHFSHELFWGRLGKMLTVTDADGNIVKSFLIPIIPVTGAVLLVLLAKLFPGEMLGYGFPQFLELVNVGGAKLKKRWVILKTLASSITIGSGGSAGFEGPTAQVGGALGYAIGQFTKVGSGTMKIWIAAGAAGAIAAVFNAPIAGVLFAQEIILLGDFTLNTLTVTVVSAGVATAVSRGYFGAQPLFIVPQYAPTNLFALPLYAALGIFVGLLAAGYIFLFDTIKTHFEKWKAPAFTKPIAGAFAVGCIAIAFPQILGEGFKSISNALVGNIDLRLAFFLIFLKMLANALTLGSGNTGGIFAPCLFIGTMAGLWFGTSAQRIFPNMSLQPGLFALVGMGAFLAAATHAPLTAIFLIFEITDNHHIVLAAFFGTFVATTVARAIMPSSIDRLELEKRGVDLQAGFELNVMKSIPLKDVMRVNPICVKQNTTLDQVVRLVHTSDQNCFPIIDAQSCYKGMVSLPDIRQVMFEKEVWKLVVVQELELPYVTPILQKENISDAIKKFVRTGLDELAVIDSEDKRQVVGLIRRADILSAYHHKEVLLSEVS